MGSGYYNHPGGGSNFICLPDNPVYDKYLQGWQGTGAIYGTEYETGNFPGFSKNLNNQDAPCAVCYVKSRGSQMMIPATNKWMDQRVPRVLDDISLWPQAYQRICVH